MSNNPVPGPTLGQPVALAPARISMCPPGMIETFHGKCVPPYAFNIPQIIPMNGMPMGMGMPGMADAQGIFRRGWGFF